MKTKLLIFSLIFLICLPASYLFAQQDMDEDELDELREMDLEELLRSEIKIASPVPLSMREAPGIVTLITRDEIINTGSRDLVDVLNLLVPGFHFEQSQFGPISISVRGIWAFEGKVLLLIDGLECNDEIFSGITLGNHYLVENIERIEIIRGPGSVTYGGHAGLGVINIVTRDVENFEGAYAGIQYSQMEKSFSHRNLSFGVAQRFGDVDLGLTGYLGEGKINDNEIVQYFSDKTPIQNPGTSAPAPSSGKQSGTETKLNPFLLNLKAKYKGLSFSGIYEKYNMKFLIPIDFESFSSQLKYEYKLNDDVQLAASYSLKFQNPWNIKTRQLTLINSNFVDTTYSNNKRVSKNNFELSMLWNISPDLYLMSGLEYLNTKAFIDSYTDGYYEIPLSNGKDEVRMTIYSAYSQVMYMNDFVNITIGGRYDYSKEFESSFVPRIAITKIFDPFHIKLMFSQAYRVPGGIQYNKSLNPEKSVNFEIEGGFQFSNSNFITLNFYNVAFKDIITLTTDTMHTTTYKNLDKIGTAGIEAEYRLVKKRFTLGVNFSYYRVTENTVEAFKVPDHGDVLLANPQVKISLFSNLKLNKKISVNPSVTFYGSRFGFTEGKFQQVDQKIKAINTIKEFNPTAIFDVNFRSDDLLLNGLQIDLGIKNVFNAEFEYIQAFNGFSPPILANSTAIVLRMYYELPF